MNPLRLFVASSLLFALLLSTSPLLASPMLQDDKAKNDKTVGMVIKNGEAQIVNAFKDSNRWIRPVSYTHLTLPTKA